jgi:hypothetical protein
LHRIEVVWGDGKADNVLIDANKDAWLIDFGGGWTQDWVDESLAGTFEGDTQAVEKIEEFLGVEKRRICCLDSWKPFATRSKASFPPVAARTALEPKCVVAFSVSIGCGTNHMAVDPTTLQSPACDIE